MNTSLQPRPRVTVYVPSRQYGIYLPQCLDSLARQTLADWEAILIDDASTDDSLALMEAFRARFPERVRVLHNERDAGLPLGGGPYYRWETFRDYCKSLYE